ncbi:hypothetical protein JW824_02930 [bacterium]|nr:hypothetical protein [bacterium]RQV98301.1 MAG: hypothetical protein EH221_02140 [bacterium]
MKQTPGEQQLEIRFRPGQITKSGFMGDDTRHIHDIIEADGKVLERFGLKKADIADRLTLFMDEGKKELEGKVDLGEYVVQVHWARGLMPCPFGEPGLHPKVVVHVFSKASRQEIRYSQLSVHMIRKHGFWGGKGSVFRLEPIDVIRLLKMGGNGE